MSAFEARKRSCGPGCGPIRRALVFATLAAVLAFVLGTSAVVGQVELDCSDAVIVGRAAGDASAHGHSRCGVHRGEPVDLGVFALERPRRRAPVAVDAAELRARNHRLRADRVLGLQLPDLDGKRRVRLHALVAEVQPVLERTPLDARRLGRVHLEGARTQMPQDGLLDLRLQLVRAPGPTALALVGHPCLVALSPVTFCQRSTMTSQYSGAISSATQLRPRCSAAISVVPEPQNGSYTTSPDCPWLRIGLAMHS